MNTIDRLTAHEKALIDRYLAMPEGASEETELLEDIAFVQAALFELGYRHVSYDPESDDPVHVEDNPDFDCGPFCPPHY